MQPATPLTLAAGAQAVRLARRVAERSTGLRRDGEPAAPAPALDAPRGAFVTLRRGDELRGCIGIIDARQPLREAIEEVAPDAARDPRFPPVTAREWDVLRVEVSVLTPPERVDVPPERLAALVRIGETGVIVAGRGARGLLLPQVAEEHGFTAEQFLSAACRKASLPPDAWRDARAGLSWTFFRAQAFEEVAPRGEVVERLTRAA